MYVALGLYLYTIQNMNNVIVVCTSRRHKILVYRMIIGHSKSTDISTSACKTAHVYQHGPL